VTLNATNWLTVSTLVVSVPSGGQANALIVADGDITLSGSSPLAGTFELRLMVDGVAVRSIRSQVINNNMGNLSASWQVHMISTLDPGQHDIRLDALKTTSSSGVSLLLNNVNPGRLSAVLLRK
jgi:hypothetical protein